MRSSRATAPGCRHQPGRFGGRPSRPLRAVLKRLGITTFDPPFRDFNTFYKHWRAEGAVGNRRPGKRGAISSTSTSTRSMKRAGRARSQLDNVHPRRRHLPPQKVTGWPRVDERSPSCAATSESASTQQDYSNVGNDCVAILEALSATVYDHSRHQRGDDAEPPVARITKARLDRYVEVEFAGRKTRNFSLLAPPSN